MKQIKLLPIFCLFGIASCKIKNESVKDSEYINYCRIIDTIIFNYEHKLSNQYLTYNLSLLSYKTGIPDRSFKGTIGCTYQNDSIFYSDMHKYQEVLKCASHMPYSESIIN
jgi:hypothetical protein